MKHYSVNSSRKLNAPEGRFRRVCFPWRSCVSLDTLHGVSSRFFLASSCCTVAERASQRTTPLTVVSRRQDQALTPRWRGLSAWTRFPAPYPRRQKFPDGFRGRWAHTTLLQLARRGGSFPLFIPYSLLSRINRGRTKLIRAGKSKSPPSMFMVKMMRS